MIAEEVSDLRESWMKHADAVLADEDIVAAVDEALAPADLIGAVCDLIGEVGRLRAENERSSAARTSMKLKLSFYEFMGSRLGLAAIPIPPLAEPIRPTPS